MKKTIMGREGGGSTVTLLYAAKDGRHNNAVALAEYMAERVHSSGSNRRVKRFNC
ncbi:hypothetical protein [Nitrososphaera sp.]|uniref:hypothetical protein n=1 Tax=Nitrososphaera sp. TaxID=1971748 RepID=UPI00307F0AA3